MNLSVMYVHCLKLDVSDNIFWLADTFAWLTQTNM